ncbi:hypothetical protein DL766_007784 [Monosporascus sp. MC13-8B]|uniref:Uncharacterized protein n=1 Tax=Monosporascus cannonballus TaxID=155416 RepID=A0ABY0H2K1_9PEZI|nr:hypothetical protein DL762_006628 [Monosporascus cannonballus]RYO87976.1 hypothetical protein DL763_006178 [Monosporascus cannonballus]RYP22084.1 hypothetical protein DL766_007784 [Monosporascus sp. MC13-8B]
MAINQFKFLAAKSIRTSTIILSSFNTISAFATAAGILFDCYLKAKRSDPRGNRQLRKYSMIENAERVGASRMIYYLVVAVLSNALMVPFFVSITITDPMNGGGTSLTLAMVSSVVANVSGLMTGGLYLFLRSSTISTIGAKDKIGDYSCQKIKQNIRHRGPCSVDFNDHIVQLVPAPRPLRTAESQEKFIPAEEGNGFEPENNRTSRSLNQRVFGDYDQPRPYMSLDSAFTPRGPEPHQMSMSLLRTHVQKPPTSYSLFPNNHPDMSPVALLPSTTYSPNSDADFAEPQTLYVPDPTSSLMPPAHIGSGGRGHHRRGSSLASTATVQIGLRFSNVDDIGPLASKASGEAERVHSLGCPNKLGSPGSKRPSPLAGTRHAESIPNPSAGNANPHPETMKSLPPLPAPSPTVAQTSPPQTLSPSVYSPSLYGHPSTASLPTGRIISPQGGGFNSPRRTNISSDGSIAVPAPLRIRRLLEH